MRRFDKALLFAAVALLAPAAARAQSPQAQAQVSAWYNRFLGRDMDAGGLGWAQSLDQGQPPAKVLAAIMASPEAYQRAGGTPENYVTGMFIDLTGRTPTADEQRFWLRRLLHARGDRPGYDELSDLAYAMALRYPTVVEAVPVVAAPVAVPTVVVPIDRDHDRDRDRDRRDWGHDEYDYRRPVYPAVRWDHDHYDHDRDHHDDHDREHRDDRDRRP